MSIRHINSAGLPISNSLWVAKIQKIGETFTWLARVETADDSTKLTTVVFERAHSRWLTKRYSYYTKDFLDQYEPEQSVSVGTAEAAVTFRSPILAIQSWIQLEKVLPILLVGSSFARKI